ncbi:methionyl-tRNA formyltransferase [Leucobacter chromiiresistens]|uniref:Methionyl-tRNA formyltransferase n=1 Tax=Leucobacter chromiiresistens TaxID=1079994 RepID=A0A147EQC7_9MICO|nr:methionyl-tRNA formyltransferase [Leucobacter chromiiresistens]KTR86605.1 methionyl-tRNA formyltransferase [Leucobacter chromiiresistens]
MRIVFAGTPEFAVPSLAALRDAGHEIAGVITREDAPLGRKRVLTPSPVAVAAEALSIPVLRANRLDETATAWVRELHADLGVIVAYGGLVREPLLSLPKLGWINLHFSELPRWRGAAPVQRALEAGEQRLGVTVFRLVPALDAGDVLARDAREFAEGTPAGDALTELASFGTAALTSAVAALDRDPGAGEAQAGEATYARKLSRDDGRLRLGGGSRSVLAQWAGMTPEPGAYALHEHAPLKVLELRAVPEDSGEARTGASAAGAAEGVGAVSLQDGRAMLALHDGALELVRVQPAGKAAMDGVAWLRGRGGSAVLA